MLNFEIPERLKRLEIPGRVTFLEGNGDLTKIEVTTEWSAAELYLHGAQVTDFQRRGEPPLLFTSQCSRFEKGQPIRGGIPIIFPWFGAREGEPAHGFARLAEWELHEATALPAGGVSLRFALPETAESAVWPPFTAYYAVTVTDQLEVELILTNGSDAHDFTFETCLHTYFAVGDVQAISVRGLQGTAYLDKVEQFARKTDLEEALRVGAEVDRIYLDTTAAVEIDDRQWKRRIRIEKQGSASTIVWNPWVQRSQQMPDLGNEEYRRMVCVESGNVADNKLTLKPGTSASLRVVLSSQPG
jgi:D-hexose-6-phosphate mutarotase